jgi:hypothetical protein
MMVTLRPWPTRTALRTARRLPARAAPRECPGQRLPRFRLALAWRRPPREASVPAEKRSTTVVNIDNRLHLVLVWSAEIRGLIDRVVETTIRTEPAVRIFTRLGPAMSLRARQPRPRERDDRPPAPGGAALLLRLPQESRPDFSPRRFTSNDRPFAPRVFRARVGSRPDPAGSPFAPTALAWPLQRFASRARKGPAVGPEPVAATSPRHFVHRAAAKAPRLFAPAATEELAPVRPARRAFRRTQQSARPVAAPRRVDMVWRKAPRGEATRTGETISHNVRRAASAPAASMGWTAPAGPTSVSATASVPRSAGAAAIQIDPATMNRLTHEVIGRIEQRLRVERERRGG